MRIASIVCAAMMAGLSAATNAADWFDNVGAQMGRIEPWSDGSIWLSIPLSAGGNPISVLGRTSSCSITQIHLVPPVGQEKAWLAALLAATSAGKAVAVFGECVASNSRIDASRLVVDY